MYKEQTSPLIAFIAYAQWKQTSRQTDRQTKTGVSEGHIKNYKKKIILQHCFVPLGFLQWEIRFGFPGGSQLRESRATQPTVHAGCFSIFIIHRILIWTTGSLTCAQMFNACGYTRECTDTVRESALKVDWNKNLLLHWGIERHAGPTLVV